MKSNRESGYGRFDLALFPKTKGRPGILMEFKRARNEGEMEGKAKEALKQMEDKEYHTQFQKAGVSVIWRYGIAFFGKQVRLLRG